MIQLHFLHIKLIFDYKLPYLLKSWMIRCGTKGKHYFKVILINKAIYIQISICNIKILNANVFTRDHDTIVKYRLYLIAAY